MGGIIDVVEYLGLPGSITFALIAVYVFVQIVGEIIELCGKAVPEFFKIRKFFVRKKQEKLKQKELLENVKTSLDEINTHYNADNIAKRNEWMTWVNKRAEVYDEALDDLRAMKDTLKANNEITLDLYINSNRNRIIDFASKVSNDNMIISKEEFKRIFKIHQEYEETLNKYNKTNGEVDVAYRVITEAYADRLKDNTFLEDIRGYNKK